MLSITTLAYRPLLLNELAIISGLPAEISNHANRIREIVGLYGSFLTIKGGVVYLIHQSAKDYLTGRASQTIFLSGSGQVYRTMFVQSVKALSTGRLQRDIYDLQHPGITIDNVEVPKPNPLAGIPYS